jgi:hypothetical protein
VLEGLRACWQVRKAALLAGGWRVSEWLCTAACV